MSSSRTSACSTSCAPGCGFDDRGHKVRAPSSEERAKEASVLYSNLADVGTTAILIIVAVVTGSLTILSEAVRSVAMIGVSFYAYWVMKALHRERLTQFEYGVGKIEQLVWVVVGLSLIFGAVWVGRSVVDTVVSSEPAASPLGLAMAAIVNAVNLVVNFLGWYAMVVAARGDPSGAFGAQLRARLTMLIASLFLQTTLTAAALARDGAIALGLDAVGALFVTGLMLYNGTRMIARALPDLLDAPAAEQLRALIRATLASVLPEGEIVSIRSRRSGPTTFAAVTVSHTAFPSLAALQDASAAVADRLRHAGVEVDLIIAPAMEGGQPDVPEAAEEESGAPPVATGSDLDL
jgi:divalent metal cation (Fe/Co/Zn/Cd) transporter